MNGTVEYWLDLADYDIETAKAMLNTGRYLYVGFMCHQVAEKSIKAVIACDCTEGEIPPKTHDLIRLAKESALIDSFSEEQMAFLRKLAPLNIEARYPEYKERLMSILTNDYCKNLVSETEALLCWIKQQL